MSRLLFITAGAVLFVACGGSAASIPSLTPEPTREQRESCADPPSLWESPSVEDIPTNDAIQQIPSVTPVEIDPLIFGEDPFPTGEPNEVSVVAFYPPVGEFIAAVARNNTGQPLLDVAFVAEALDESGAVVACASHPGLGYPRVVQPGELVWERVSFCGETCQDLAGVTQTRVRAIGTPGSRPQIVEMRIDLAKGSYDGTVTNPQPRDIFFSNIDALCIDESGNPSIPLALALEYPEAPIAPGEKIAFNIRDRDFETLLCASLVISATAYDPTGGAAQHY